MIPSSPAHHVRHRQVPSTVNGGGTRVSLATAPDDRPAGSEREQKVVRGPREAAITIGHAGGAPRRTRSRRGHGAGGLQRKATPDLRTSVSNQPAEQLLRAGRRARPHGSRGWRDRPIVYDGTCELMRWLVCMEGKSCRVTARRRSLVPVQAVMIYCIFCRPAYLRWLQPRSNRLTGNQKWHPGCAVNIQNLSLGQRTHSHEPRTWFPNWQDLQKKKKPSRDTNWKLLGFAKKQIKNLF